MKSKNLVKIILIFIGLLFLLFWAEYFISRKNKIETVFINGKKFEVEVVSSKEKVAKGLGERDYLCDYCGMLFEFGSPGKYSFWMKGMRFSLDIIWILDDEVVYIAKNMPPGSLETVIPSSPADRVLELNGGTCQKDGIKEGDKVNF